MIKLPVDFEERVRRPPVVGGAGYPYRISAKDLMDNFKAVAAGGGLPEGFTVKRVWLCEDGEPVEYEILARVYSEETE